MQKQNTLLIAGIALVTFFDVFSKFLAQKFLAKSIEILPILKLELAENSQLAFGIPFPRILIILLSIAAIIFFGNLFAKSVQKESKLGTITFALILGGALGNLGERILFGKVTDFISFLIIPNFNLADASLTIGVTLIILFHYKIFTKI